MHANYNSYFCLVSLFVSLLFNWIMRTNGRTLMHFLPASWRRTLGLIFHTYFLCTLAGVHRSISDYK